MSNNQETKPLLSDEQGDDGTYRESYGRSTDHDIQSASASHSWWKENKEKIPGYGMLTMLKKVW